MVAFCWELPKSFERVWAPWHRWGLQILAVGLAQPSAADGARAPLPTLVSLVWQQPGSDVPSPGSLHISSIIWHPASRPPEELLGRFRASRGF